MFYLFFSPGTIEFALKVEKIRQSEQNFGDMNESGTVNEEQKDGNREFPPEKGTCIGQEWERSCTQLGKSLKSQTDDI